MVYVTPIDPTLADWVGLVASVAVPALIVFWPTIYALLKRRWIRGLAYCCLTLPVVWVTLNGHHWWGPVDPENDFSPLKNGLYYRVFNWPLMIAVLWTITAVSDAFLARETSVAEHD